MKEIVITTKLIDKEEIFRVLAISHATGKPALFVGPPGTGKTRALLDYSHALYKDPSKTDKENIMESIKNSFILETEEETKSTAVKGNLDLEELIENKKYKMTSPIVDAKFVMINEVEKANAGLRNSLLSIMNEKVLFNGKEKVRCEWELFCASCNKINKDESEAPFWDRFVFKQTVGRIGAATMAKYLNGSVKSRETTIKLNVPDKNELVTIASRIPKGKLRKFIQTIYEKVTDRTASFSPEIIAAVSVVYDLNINQALVKACELLADKATAQELAQNIEPAEMGHIRSMIEMIQTLEDYKVIEEKLEEISREVRACAEKKIITKTDVSDLQDEINQALGSNPAYNAEEIQEDIEEAIES